MAWNGNSHAKPRPILCNNYPACAPIVDDRDANRFQGDVAQFAPLIYGHIMGHAGAGVAKLTHSLVGSFLLAELGLATTLTAYQHQYLGGRDWGQCNCGEILPLKRKHHSVVHGEITDQHNYLQSDAKYFVVRWSQNPADNDGLNGGVKDKG